jgi:cytosine/adenosine deaminase-related metal-dependent hydrolase
MTDRVRLLPTEVQLAVELQPCLAERRTYEPADEKHPCEFFADQGSFHAYDLRDPGPPPTPGSLQDVRYAGRRRLVPEMLSGCRKAPIMAVGINPNLPAFWNGKHNSVQPVFDDLLQYVHHYRYRAIGKLQIEPAAYAKLLGGRADRPDGGAELTAPGTPLPVELANQTMYVAYQSLLDGLAEAKGWTARLTVGEDLSYGNMVACGSPRWITQPAPAMPSLPVMQPAQRAGIVDECFVKRRYFLRQLFQSLPRVLLVFSGATRDAIATTMAGHFVEGEPHAGESLDALLDRRIVLRYGKAPGGAPLDARVLFVPHASGNPQEFAAARAKVVVALAAEVDAQHLALDPASGHLRRSAGACTFCDNALYSIGPCDYKDQLVALAPREEATEDTPGDGAPPVPPQVLENRVQDALLDAFLAPAASPVGMRVPVPVPTSVIEEAGEVKPRFVVRGRVVTMKAFGVIDDAAVYVHGGVIEAVRAAREPAPDGYANAPVLATRGTIYPGLIDLHNHLAYNALPAWAVGKRYEDRSQWRRARDYAARVGIMHKLRTGNPARAVARYVEVKAMLGGATTLQGMRSSFGSVSSAMRGLVRNVEIGGKGMPRAGSSVQDLEIADAGTVAKFRAAIAREQSAYFYHLSEGVNDAARQFWQDLEHGDLLGPGLVGIHCLAVPPAGFARLAAAHAAVVWSPTSNLMLYGETLALRPVLDSGVTWVLGCDWSPTGGKNPLFELKVARAVAAAQGVTLPARELVAAVTSRAAAAVRWEAAVGQIAAGFRADLLVLAGAAADPYDQLISAVESDVELVMIDGVVRAGTTALFDAAAVPARGREAVKVGKRDQQLWLRDPGTALDGFTLERARTILVERMANPAAPDEEASEDDGFEIALDDDMAPLPPSTSSPSSGAQEESAEEAAEILAQAPDALTVQGDAALWSTLRAIRHFPLPVDALQDAYKP